MMMVMVMVMVMMMMVIMMDDLMMMMTLMMTMMTAPASRDGAETGEEPDLVLGSNREVVVEDVTPERCDLAEFGFAGETQMALAGFEAPVIETVTAKVRSGELELSLRLQPPSGSAARQLLDGVLQGLRTQARDAGKRGGRPLWRHG